MPRKGEPWDPEKLAARDAKTAAMWASRTHKICPLCNLNRPLEDFKCRKKLSERVGRCVPESYCTPCVHAKQAERRRKSGIAPRHPKNRTETHQNCSRCKKHLPFSCFSIGSKKSGQEMHSWCKECMASRRMETRYGLTLEQYAEKLADQGGCCAICGSTDSKRSTSQRLPVDHDHETGEVRGILCGGCNLGLGAFEDDIWRLTRAIQYLQNG